MAGDLAADPDGDPGSARRRQAGKRGAQGRSGEDPADPRQDAALIGRGGAAPRVPMVHRRSPLLYAFLLLPLAYLLTFVGFPIVYNLVASLQKVTVGNIAALARPFVGFDNYSGVLADPAFRKVFINSIVFVGANVAAQVGLGLAVALFFAQRFAGAQWMRGALLAGWMLPA